ncbi:PKD domain-containing protein [Hymenobacter sediminis]|nr:PKD domain-containing protein [Hymenobacter sediminis]
MTIRITLILLSLLLSLTTQALPPGRPLVRTASPAPTPTLEFVENRGQWDARARYMAELPAGRLFLTSTGFTYTLADPAALQAAHEHTTGTPAPTLRSHAYAMLFEGGNSRATVQGNKPTAEVRNYYLGKDPSHWASKVPGFREVTYTNVYPGIGIKLYENAAALLEYDFTVAPGARPDQIRLRYQGAGAVELREGMLRIKTSVGEVIEQAPKAWQEAPGGQRQAVSCQYELRNGVVSFRLGTYDVRRPLVIDPTVVFSSYTGSTADNWGYTATYDEDGNMYSGGVAFGPGFPTSLGAFDQSFAAAMDIAIIKYDTRKQGTAARLYATYLGGEAADAPHSLVVNALDQLVILGSTSSRNFPTSRSAYDASFNGGAAVDPLNGNFDSPTYYQNGSDLVVSILSPQGNALVASTYLGGSGNDGLTLRAGLQNNYGDAFRGDIITDGANNVYLVSTTQSTNFPVGGGGRGTLRGAADAVVAKLNANLSSLLWSTLLGGSADEGACSIQLSTDQAVYVAGSSTSSDFPVTSGAFLTTTPTGTNGFVARFATSGSTVQAATLLGTAENDLAYFVQLDGANNVYVLGQTDGRYPITPGLYGVAGGQQFIQKLTPDLKTGLYSTAFGSGQPQAHDLSPTAFLVDDCERVYLCGWGGSTNRGYGPSFMGRLPVTPNAIKPSSDGSDFYLVQFGAGLRNIEYATFYGENGGAGEHVDGGTSRFDKRGMVYQAVCGSCRGTGGFPTPPGANYFSKTNGSINCNNAAFKIDFGIIVADPGPTRYVCADNGPIVLGGQPAGGTWQGPGVSRLPNGSYQFLPSAELVGRNVLYYTATTTGVCQSTRPLRMIVTPVRTITIPPVPALCADGAPVTLQVTPAGGTWSQVKGLTGNVFNPRQAGPGTYTLTYSLSDSLGCGSATRVITVNAPPTPVAGPNLTLCAYETQTITLTGASPAGGVWSGPGVTADGHFTPPDTKLRGGIFTLTYTVTANGCPATATRQVLLAPSPTVNFPLSVPECAIAPRYPGQPVPTGLAPFSCPFEPVLTGGTYEWDFGDGSPISKEEKPVHIFTTPGTYLVKLTARYSNCTVETSFAPVVVGEVFVPNIITPNGDTKNETFIPHFSCQPASLRVFSRWGAKVYETTTYRNDWSGANLPDGTYYYHLQDTEGRTAKGWLTVQR